MFASLSIYGLYVDNPEIFDNFSVPEGMDKDTAVTQILAECSDFALIYPNYEFMKMLIVVWSTKEQLIWSNLYKSETLEYNPIENYDRHESLTRAVNSNSKGKSNGLSSNTATDNGKNVSARTAYDSTTLRDTARNVADSHSEAQNVSAETAENTSEGNEVVSNHVHGNIGVTTAQQMIEGFREVSKFCTYDYIVQSFKDRFCIQVF